MSSGGSAGSSNNIDQTAGKPIGTGKPEGRGRKGAMPDSPDARDQHYVPTIDASTLPASVDLRPLCPPIYDQGNVGSCTANAIAAAIEFNQMQSHQKSFTPSRLFIFYNERVLEGTVNTPDAGAMIRTGIKTVVRLGAPPEDVWVYDESAVTKQPLQNAYAAARLDLVSVYSRVGQTLSTMQACLAEGFPIVFCCSTYSSMSVDSTDGVIPMPAPTDQYEGGHAMVIVGYDNATQTFLIRNSWGTSWGLAGYGSMPYDYLANPKYTWDLWTIRSVVEREAKPLYSPFDDKSTPAFQPHTGAGGTAD